MGKMYRGWSDSGGLEWWWLVECASGKQHWVVTALDGESVGIYEMFFFFFGFFSAILWPFFFFFFRD